MNDFEIFGKDPLLLDDFDRSDFHLPLDWNEEVSLEEYLERLEATKEN